jgi:hypothetical protein
MHMTPIYDTRRLVANILSTSSALFEIAAIELVDECANRYLACFRFISST